MAWKLIPEESKMAWVLYHDDEVVGECSLSVPPEQLSAWFQKALFPAAPPAPEGAAPDSDPFRRIASEQDILSQHCNKAAEQPSGGLGELQRAMKAGYETTEGAVVSEGGVRKMTEDWKKSKQAEQPSGEVRPMLREFLARSIFEFFAAEEPPEERAQWPSSPEHQAYYYDEADWLADGLLAKFAVSPRK